jgi:hypothetical protein
MKKLVSASVVLAAMALPLGLTGANAQQGAVSETPPPALSQRIGITVEEASRRLRLQYEAAAVLDRLRQQGQADEVFINIEGGQAVLYRAPASSLDAQEVLNLFDPSLRPNVAQRTMPRAPKELRNAAERLIPVLQKTLGVVGIQLKRKEGQVVILVENVERTRALLAPLLANAPSYVSIQSSPPIELTAIVRGGRPAAYATGTTCAGGTWGYVVYETANSARRGVLTAAHVSEENQRKPLIFPTTSAITDCRSGTSQSYVNGWRGTSDSQSSPRYGVDISYHRNTTDTYEPSIWDGSSYRSVRYQFTPPAGSYLCKFGRTTGQTCGVLQADLIWSNGYGYMSWVKADAGISNMVDVGDSGGPVWSGFTYTDAVGIVHARWGATNLLYSELATLQDRGTGLTLLRSP